MSDRLDAEVRFAIVPEWILDAEVSDRAVRLYALLARYADRAGTAFPSRRTLAGRLRCTVRSVDRALGELLELGAVQRSWRFDRGRQTSSRYLLRPVTGATRLSQGGDTGVSPGGDTGVAQNESQRNENQKDLAAAARPRPKDELFESLARAGGHQLDRLTRSERGRINAAAKQLRELDATAADVDAAVRAWAKRYPGATVTPMALVHHWSELQPGGAVRPTVGPDGRSFCQHCGTPWSTHDDEVCRLIAEGGTP